MRFLTAGLLCGALISAWIAFEIGSGSIILYEPSREHERTLKRGDWQPGGRPWHWPEDQMTLLEVSPMVCMLKTSWSPEQVC